MSNAARSSLANTAYHHSHNKCAIVASFEQNRTQMSTVRPALCFMCLMWPDRSINRPLSL